MSFASSFAYLCACWLSCFSCQAQRPHMLAVCSAVIKCQSELLAMALMPCLHLYHTCSLSMLQSTHQLETPVSTCYDRRILSRLLSLRQSCARSPLISMPSCACIAFILCVPTARYRMATSMSAECTWVRIEHQRADTNCTVRRTKSLRPVLRA